MVKTRYGANIEQNGFNAYREDIFDDRKNMGGAYGGKAKKGRDLVMSKLFWLWIIISEMENGARLSLAADFFQLVDIQNADLTAINGNYLFTGKG